MARRTYTKKQKLSATLAADMVGVVAAEKATGIPESTIRYWMDRPEFAEVRAKAREELAEEIRTIAHLAWARIAETIGSMEPRDALFAAEKATSLHLLMSGEATSRTEHREADDPDVTAVRDLERRLASLSTAVPLSVEPRSNGARPNGQH